MQFVIKPETSYPNAKNLSTIACTVPFKHIEIHSSGAVSACCHTWLPAWVGNLLEDSVDDVINNGIRKEIQDKMREGDFVCCNDQCPQLSSFLSGEKFYWDFAPLGEFEKKLEDATMHVGFSYDLSCNLQCPSCRDNLIFWDYKNPEDHDGQRIKKIHDKVKDLISVLVTQHKRVSLNITGSGDAFASPLYWDYLVELSQSDIPDNIVVNLKTNGVLMTRENLELIKPLWPYIGYIEVSVDAATEEVYKIVRKNGNFKKLQKNLASLDELIAAGWFPKMHVWQTNLIVQRDNYKDLKAFVEWQLTLKSKPLIWTNLLAQWGHISDERFKGMAIWQEGHVNRGELIEILKDPIFKNKQVKLGNMTSLLPAL